MTAPARTDVEPNVLTVPGDPATEALIAASIAAHKGDLAELDRLSTLLQVGVADYGKQLRAAMREAGLA